MTVTPQHDLSRAASKAKRARKASTDVAVSRVSDHTFMPQPTSKGTVSNARLVPMMHTVRPIFVNEMPVTNRSPTAYAHMMPTINGDLDHMSPGNSSKRNHNHSNASTIQ